MQLDETLLTQSGRPDIVLVIFLFSGNKAFSKPIFLIWLKHFILKHFWPEMLIGFKIVICLFVWCHQSDIFILLLIGAKEERKKVPASSFHFHFSFPPKKWPWHEKNALRDKHVINFYFIFPCLGSYFLCRGSDKAWENAKIILSKEAWRPHWYRSTQSMG